MASNSLSVLGVVVRLCKLLKFLCPKTNVLAFMPAAECAAVPDTTDDLVRQAVPCATH